MARVLILPGHGDSGPGHWQTLWEESRGFERVVQDEWERPELAAWLARLGERVSASPEPVVLVAHSLACALVAHFAATPLASRVAAALLVAPADVDSELHTPDEVRSFAPLPLVPLPFPTVVIASRIDPYVRFARATAFAEAWGARLVDAGRSGHLNVDSGHGPFPEGLAELDGLLATARG
ncbi:MAG: alpha/beta hydrolase [Deltaproteobacteria bacterium]|nr:alpha/beta hydrolase [Deltaproteobacteria bacterium]